MASVRVTVDALIPEADTVNEAARILLSHGVVSYPTETFYALGAIAFDDAACSRIFDIKGRDAGKALPCIVADRDQLESVTGELPSVALALASCFWPGPLTLVVPLGSGVAAARENATLAVRVSSLPLATALARAVGPLTSTSANRAGEGPMTRAVDVHEAFGDRIDLVLDGGGTPGGKPSTIVDVTGAELRLVREGAIAFDDIVESLQS